MVPTMRRNGEPSPLYSPGDDLFSIEVHHGGLFVGQGENRAYIDEKVDWFDHCDTDSWSPLWFDDFIGQLGYKKSTYLKVYWLLPGKTLADGLRIIATDADTLVMTSIVEKVKNFVVYLDHDDNVAGINWDDIVANPIATLPKVMSPHKVHVVERKAEEKLPEFYSNVRVEVTTTTEQRGNAEPNSASEDSEEDSDFVDSDYELGQEDDDLFVDNVDEEVVDEGVAKGKKIGKGKKTSGKRLKDNNGNEGTGEQFSSDDEGLQLPHSDGEGETGFKFKTWMPEDINNPIFKVGMVFGSAQELRKAITEYSLKNRVNIKISRNEKKRINAVCEKDCPWKLNSSEDKRCNGIMIKIYNAEHNCQKKWELKRCTANWLAEKYLETFRADDKMTLTNFARTVQKEWHLTPSRSKLARARRLAMQKIHGDEVKQYSMLWDYAQELRRTNPGSTFYLNLLGPRFSTLYISLDACKRGFLSACRPIICLDGCHIKTKFGGQLLTAVGIDPNDCIYPIAMGVVEVESLKTWKWFLETLKQDLGIDNTYPWTIMTDKQKGLIPAVQQVFPDSEHRFCVRHLYSNFQQHFKGENLKNQLWACARSSSVVEWNKNMEIMKALNEKAYEWLEKMPPNTWVRAFFSTFPKCDILLNNSCEVFNKYILDAREMPILSMLERIKCQLMTRHYTKGKEVGEVWAGPICPKIRKKVQKNVESANTCYALPAGKGIFLVENKGFSYTVDIIKHQCDCRRWDLTGIPCSHGMACLRNERISAESVLPQCYKAEAYATAYGHSIWPCSDKSTWQKVEAAEVLPPVYVKKVGRPPKSRKKQPFEKEGANGETIMSRHGTVITCRYCGGSGHNSGGCELKKAGLRPKLQPQRNPATASVECVDEDEPVITQEHVQYEIASEPTTSQVSYTMLSQMEVEATQCNRVEVEQEPLPDSLFILSNRPAARPVPPTTATKEGKAMVSKRKAAGEPGKKKANKKHNN